MIALLGRDRGTSVAELMAATGWLPHTTRAALTGLRKRGYALIREAADGGSVYRIAPTDRRGGLRRWLKRPIARRPGRPAPLQRPTWRSVAAEIDPVWSSSISQPSGWRSATARAGSHRPASPSVLLFKVLAYRVQAEAFGDLRPDTRRLLDRITATSGEPGTKAADAPSVPVRDVPKRGTVLVREWQGRMEHVMVLDEGFAWNGRSYPSLSAVAFAITGTKWNGRRFFGLDGRTVAGNSASAGAKPRGSNETAACRSLVVPRRSATDHDARLVRPAPSPAVGAVP